MNSITSTDEDASGAKTCMIVKTQMLGGIRYMPFDPTMEKYRMIASMVGDDSRMETCMKVITRDPGRNELCGTQSGG